EPTHGPPPEGIGPAVRGVRLQPDLRSRARACRRQRPRQRDPERAALFVGVLETQLAAVRFDGPLRDREPQSRAADVFGLNGGAAFVAIENPAANFGRDSGTTVADR